MPEQMSGLKPTYQDSRWYEEQKEKDRQRQQQEFAGQQGIVTRSLMGLGGFAQDVLKDNEDNPIMQVLRGFGHADYMAKTQAKTMHGETGEQFLGALEVADTAVSLGATGAIRQAPRLAKEVAEAGAKDIKNLGVGQATLATLQEGIDRLPPPGPQMQLAGIPNGGFARQQMERFTPPTVMEAVTTTNPDILVGS